MGSTRITWERASCAGGAPRSGSTRTSSTTGSASSSSPSSSRCETSAQTRSSGTPSRPSAEVKIKVTKKVVDGSIRDGNFLDTQRIHQMHCLYNFERKQSYRYQAEYIITFKKKK